MLCFPFGLCALSDALSADMNWRIIARVQAQLSAFGLLEAIQLEVKLLGDAKPKLVSKLSRQPPEAAQLASS